MRTAVTGGVVAVGLVGFMAAPVSATPEKNPNVFVGSDLVCANDFTADKIFIVGRTGHDSSGASTGTAQSASVIDGPGGNVVFRLFAVPGKGLDDLTTTCEWLGEDGSWFRGEILLRGSLR